MADDTDIYITEITPYAFDNIGWRYYLVFCILSATNAVFFWAFLPETKGRPLEEMHIIFRDSSVFVPGNKVPVRGKHEAEEQLRRGESSFAHLLAAGECRRADVVPSQSVC